MSPLIISLIIVCYFAILLLISRITSRNANNASFFLGNRQSRWYIVAIGMIGASISGVTFISVPGWVGTTGFTYMQVVLGYLAGYFVIATVLMPLYYKLELTSIYTYLEQRFGKWAYKTGVVFFLFSRTFGASARMYLVANVLQFTILDKWNVPFVITVVVSILMIWLYTHKGGIKTIIWTDTLQAVFFITAVILTVVIISGHLGLNFKSLVQTISHSHYSGIFYFDNWKEKHYFWKHFIGGAFIAIAMTGLDQDMMQKNLSCRNIREAQKNMFTFSVLLVPVNLIFLSLGALLFIFVEKYQIPLPEKSDNLYPMIATGNWLNIWAGIFFIIGIIAAAYSSADSALTALTTSFSVDVLEIQKLTDELKKTNIRRRVHVGVSAVMLIVILIFQAVNNTSVIDAIFIAAGYTYGPLLGIFSFGLLTKRSLPDNFLVPAIAITSPFLSYYINLHSAEWFNGYKFGYELLIMNGFLTFIGLFTVSNKVNKTNRQTDFNA